MTTTISPTSALRRELIVAEQQKERALAAHTTTTPIPVLSEAAIAADLEVRRGASLTERVRTAATTRPTMPVPVIRAAKAIAARRSDGARIARRASRLRTVRRSGLSILTVLFVMAVVLVTTIPVQSLIDPRTMSASMAPVVRLQSLPPQELSVLTGGADTAVSRDGYTVVNKRAELRAKLAATAAGRTPAFVNDPAGSIQWPFVNGVPMSDQFGPRVLCDTCGVTMHNGADFLPGRGAPIQAIADGTVRYIEESDDGLGVHVIIDHNIDGQLVSSVYCHMEFGSVPLQVGQQVRTGELVGTVGDTGFAFGPHLHFEIRLDGTKNVDPVAWLEAHAN